MYVTGTVRNIEDPYLHGNIAKVDWDSGEVLILKDRVFPAAFCTRNGNPRGGTRGWRGIVSDKDGGVIVANNDSLVYFDKNLEHKQVVTHPAFGNIHGLSWIGSGLCITSTLTDTFCIYDGKKVEVIEPLADFATHKMVKEWLKIRTRERKPFDNQRDYREEWIEDTLHLNYVAQSSTGDLIALFNSMNLLVKLSPWPEILWSAPLELGELEAPDDMDALMCPHDLVFDSGYTCLINSSARRTLYRFSLITKQLEHIWTNTDDSIEWNRGLSIVGDHVFIGSGDGIVIEIDLKSGQEIKRVRVFPSDEFPCSVFGVLV